jgi:diguanylate cyclase (GGDEF)-like protein
LIGMAARDPDPSSTPAARDRAAAVDAAPALAADELARRLDEEIGRAERYGTKLSCLLVVVDNLDELSREHGGGLAEQTITYIADALARELRRFDRVGRPGAGELMVVLPGTDSPLGEVVARRLLARIHTIKVESRGTRHPLRIAVGLAPWQPQMSSADLLARARVAARRQNGEDPPLARLAGGAPALFTEAAAGVDPSVPPIGPDGSS